MFINQSNTHTNGRHMAGTEECGLCYLYSSGGVVVVRAVMVWFSMSCGGVVC
jgi:hypothetical protein